MIGKKNRSSFRETDNGKEEYWKGNPRFNELICPCGNCGQVIDTFDRKTGQFAE